MSDIALVIKSFLAVSIRSVDNMSCNNYESKLESFVLSRGGWSSVVADRKMVFVGSKLLKIAASDFSYQCFPTADTEKLTALVAHCLMQHSMLQYYRERHNFDRLDPLIATLSAVAEVIGTSTAASLVIPYFRHAIETNRHCLDVPQIICSLAPGTNLQGLGRHERINLIQDELAKRGRFVLSARCDDDGGYDDQSSQQSQFVVDVTFMNQVCSTYRGTSSTHAHELAVLEEARKLIAQATKLCRADGTRVAVPSTQRIVSLTMLDDAQYLAHLSWVMRQIRLILRLKNPYEELLRSRGHFEDILNSDGWVPLRIVLDLIVEKHHAMKNNITDPTEALLLEVLDDHDNLQRFEVGECTTVGSPFAKLRCARALYAHELGPQSTSLFVNILNQWERPADHAVPATAWALADRKAVKEFGTRGFKLFDQCAFVTLVDTKYLAEFAEYGKRPLSQQFDEKIRNENVFFLEVNLAAVMKDQQMTVKQHPPRGDRTGHFIALPSGPRYNFSFKKKNVAFGKAELHFFPMAFLTRRCCEVRNAAAAVVTSNSTDGSDIKTIDHHQRVVFGTIPIPPDPVVVFEPGELEQLLAGTTAQESSPSATSDENSSAVSGLDLLLKEPVEIVRLDEQPIKDQILSFHQDQNRVNLILLVPKVSSSGAGFFARLTALKSIKEYITSLGMSYRERSRGANAKADEFMISKPQAFPQAVIEEIAGEIGVRFSNLGLLREAVTRECVNKLENYERLEFIGDAVVDWVVAYDAGRTIADYAVATTVTTDVCRNDVLCLLLPRSLHLQLQTNYGEDLHTKTRADMFEAIVGALYEDKQGLDVIRRVIMTLFQQIPNVFTSASPEERLVLNGAKRGCPYLTSSQLAFLSAIPFDCQRVVAPALTENLEELHQVYTNEDAGLVLATSQHSRRKPFETFASHLASTGSHLASTGFPRIQDKDFATHFTTGTVYSYRRVTRHDVRMHNRILSLFHSGRVAYVNETLGTILPLTFDIDGTGVLSFGLAELIAEWARTKFGPHGSMGVVLDCSGKSVVTKKMKRSCHVHFPQITMSVDDLRLATIDLRSYIVKRMGRFGLTALPGKLVKSTIASLSPTSFMSCSNQKLVVARIVCSFQLLTFRCEEEGIKLPDASRNDRQEGGDGTNILFSYLSVFDLVVLTGVSRRWRRQALTQVLRDVVRPPRYLIEMLPITDPNRAQLLELSTGARDSKWSEEEEAFLLATHTLQHYVLARPLVGPQFSTFTPLTQPDPLASLFLLPINALFVITESSQIKEYLEQVVQPSLVAIGARKLKEKEYFEDIVRPLLEQDNFGLMAWTKFIDPGLCESKKLRMYLCDKFDTVYKQEFRPLLQFALLKPIDRPRGRSGSPPRHHTAAAVEATVAALRPQASSSVASGRIIHVSRDRPTIPHASMLRLTSLRSPVYNDVGGNTYEAWDPQSVPVSPKLASFEELRSMGRSKSASSDWGLFTGSTMIIAPSGNSGPTGGDGGSSFTVASVSNNKVARHAALYPSWWSFRRDGLLQSGVARFFVAGELFGEVSGMDFSSCVHEGLKVIANEVTPHVNIEGDWRMPSTATDDFLPMFTELKGLRRGPQAITASSTAPATSLTQQMHLALQQQQMKSLSNMTSKIRSQTRRLTYLSERGGGVPLADIPHLVDHRICGEPVAVLYVVNSPSSLLYFATMKPRQPYVFHVRNLPRPNCTFRVVVVVDEVEHEMWPRALQACAKDGLVVVQSKALRDQLRLTLSINIAAA